LDLDSGLRAAARSVGCLQRHAAPALRALDLIDCVSHLWVDLLLADATVRVQPGYGPHAGLVADDDEAAVATYADAAATATHVAVPCLGVTVGRTLRRPRRRWRQRGTTFRNFIKILYFLKFVKNL